LPPPPPPAPPPSLLAPPQVEEAWVPLNRWCQANGWQAPSRFGMGPSASYTLKTASGVLVLQAGSRLAHWDGLELWLGFPPRLVGGQPYVHRLDLEKTLEPLAGVGTLDALQTNLTVVIDPGHGGADSGTSSVLANQYEKEFTLDLARRLARLLAASGRQVLLTRTSDAAVSLSNRLAFAEEHHAGVFVSLHFNSSAPDHAEAGLETYCLTPSGMPSSVTRGFEDDPGLVCPNNAFDAENLQLALRVHRALLEVNGHHDRGVRRARFPAVLRRQDRPAILVEAGYLSNPREARLIADPAYRQKLAEAVAKGLLGEANGQNTFGASSYSGSRTNSLP
jgi:N-acetylmuramoyl-L-alanine amidase